MTPLFCGNCGVKIPDTPNFCPECGYKLSQDSPDSQNDESLKIQQELLEIERERRDAERWEDKAQIVGSILSVIGLIVFIYVWFFVLTPTRMS